VFLHSAKSHLHSAKTLPSVALVKSPLGNFFHGKNTLPSAFYRGARQNIEKFCRVFVKALGKVFITVTAPAVNEYFAECHTSALGKLTFYFYF
jgi:hypothetical protein